MNVANISMPESSKGSEMFISDTRFSCPQTECWMDNLALTCYFWELTFVLSSDEWHRIIPDWIHGHWSEMRKYFLDCCFICPLLVTIVPNYSFWLVSQFFFIVSIFRINLDTKGTSKSFYFWKFFYSTLGCWCKTCCQF